MATTGFWPVKSRLKEVIDYAENPDKTIDKKYVDSDLYAALQYADDDKKTDERMYVSGINCNAKRAYEPERLHSLPRPKYSYEKIGTARYSFFGQYL